MFSNNLHNLLTKEALDVDTGDPVSRWLAATVGRANPLALPALIATGRAYHSPHTKGRLKKHEAAARALEAGSGEALEDTVLRVGGGDLIDDIIWKKERGKDLPWYKQLGGRALHNPRTSILGKLLAYPTSLGSYIAGSLVRAPHYNPYTDAAHNFFDEPSVTDHELGHAIDMNTMSGFLEEDQDPKDFGFMRRQGAGLAHDIYGVGYGIPFANLYYEAQANIRSRKALVKAWKKLGKDPEELYRRIARRAETLPAAYGSYLAGNFLAPLGPIGLLGAMGAGKAYGLTMGDSDSHILDKMGPEMAAKLRKIRDEERKAREKAKSKAASANLSDNLSKLFVKSSYTLPSNTIVTATSPLIGRVAPGINMQPIQSTGTATAVRPPAQDYGAAAAAEQLGHNLSGEQKIPGMRKTTPGATARLGGSVAQQNRPNLARRALPGAGALPLTALLGFSSLNDARRGGHMTGENISYGLRALNPFDDDFNLMPYAETAGTALGFGSAFDPAWRQEMAEGYEMGPEHWLETLRNLPKGVLDETLHQGGQVVGSVGRLAKDVGDSINRTASKLPSNSYSTTGRSTPMGTGRPAVQQ